MDGLPFDDSRRLTGINPCLDGCGAAMEVPVEYAGSATLDAWRSHVRRMCAKLQWPEPAIQVRPHASGASLAFSAPMDQLYCATEVNEWALLAALPAVAQTAWGAHAPGYPAAWDEVSAWHALAAMARAERVPGLIPLLGAAHGHQLNALLDEDTLTLGSGCLGRSWPVAELPAVDAVPWDELGDIPMALVTGSNGKTTTVRLLAAMLQAHGWRTGHSSTDGVFSVGQLLDTGDYSGPGGARMVLREPVDAAVLETARGGMLRRGLAMQHADVAVVTNVSDDHFGEYGIHDLEALAGVKLTVARALRDDGVLVVNADDALLAGKAEAQVCDKAWFALDDEHERLRAARAQGASTCGVRQGRMRLHHRATVTELGAVADMPLTLGGSARHNIANAAAASLAAVALGVEPGTVAGVLARFGSQPGDNPGRLQMRRAGGVRVLIDYAHNPDGVRALGDVVSSLRGDGRLGLVLAHAGNREDASIRALAGAAMTLAPDRVAVTDIVGYERGRQHGEVAALLRDGLFEHGAADAGVVICVDEFEAARGLLDWARTGDLLLLLVHAADARTKLEELLAQADGGPV